MKGQRGTDGLDRFVEEMHENSCVLGEFGKLVPHPGAVRKMKDNGCEVHEN